MITVRTFQCNPVQENCYVVSDDATRQCAVIDCGAFFDAERRAVVRYIREGGLTLSQVLCTHAHFDHVFGLDTLYAEFGIRPRLHPADEFIYTNMPAQVASFMGIGYDAAMPPLGESLTDGELIALGSHQLRVLHTPGHSPGSVLFYLEAERMLFAGDTLFRMSVGRTDLEGGSWTQLLDSLRRVVAQLPPDVKVYSGHGPTTTIGDEQRLNPYFRWEY